MESFKVGCQVSASARLPRTARRGRWGAQSFQPLPVAASDTRYFSQPESTTQVMLQNQVKPGALFQLRESATSQAKITGTQARSTCMLLSGCGNLPVHQALGSFRQRSRSLRRVIELQTSSSQGKPRHTPACVWPNPSLKRSANGRPPGPVWRYGVHFRQPGPGVLPLSTA